MKDAIVVILCNEVNETHLVEKTSNLQIDTLRLDTKKEMVVIKCARKAKL